MNRDRFVGPLFGLQGAASEVEQPAPERDLVAREVMEFPGDLHPHLPRRGSPAQCAPRARRYRSTAGWNSRYSNPIAHSTPVVAAVITVSNRSPRRRGAVPIGRVEFAGSSAAGVASDSRMGCRQCDDRVLRESERKPRAFADTALYVEPRTMELEDLGDNRQPQAGASRGARVHVPSPEESLADPLDLALGDAGAVVAHRDDHVVRPFVMGAHDHAAPRGCVLGGVRQQVLYDPLDQPGVGLRTEAGGDVELDGWPARRVRVDR